MSDPIQDTLSLFDLTNRAQIELRGTDRQTFLNNFCTNDVKSLSPGQGCEAFLTNIKGRILGHLIVSAAEGALWIDSVPGSSEAIVGHLDKYLITEDVFIIDRTEEVGPLALVGSQSTDWLQTRDNNIGPLTVWGQQPATIDGIDVLVRRVAFTEADGYELLVAHDRRDALTRSVCETGVIQGSAELFEALRIESGFPQYGIDLTEENIAQEAGRNEQAISFTKGCYLGQEPIARLDALGHTNKELRRLQNESGPVPPRGTKVLSTTGDEAGHITSAAASPRGEGWVALAMLKSAFAAPGTHLEVCGNDKDAAGAVVR